MEISNFKDMYLAELQELVSVEDQLSEALLRMAAAASHPALKDALVDHHAETMRQKDRLVAILRKHGADPAAHVDQAMQALIRETRKMLSILEGDDLRDAGLIASVRNSSTTRSPLTAPPRHLPASSTCVTTRCCCTTAFWKRKRPTPFSPISPRAKSIRTRWRRNCPQVRT